jgi:hypothetical protein
LDCSSISTPQFYPPTCPQHSVAWVHFFCLLCGVQSSKRKLKKKGTERNVPCELKQSIGALVGPGRTYVAGWWLD